MSNSEKLSKKVSKWDTFRIQHINVNSITVDVPTEMSVLRSRLRTEVCSQAVIEAEGIENAARADDLTAVIAARRNWWSNYVNRTHRKASLLISACGGTLFGLWIGSLLNGLLFGAMTLIGLALYFSKAKAAECVSAMLACRCPDCNYLLRGLKSPYGAAYSEWGPDRCPECGAPWPLVPPQIPGETPVKV